MPRTILVIEDDPDIAQLVALHLQDLGCAVEVAHHGHTGLLQALTMPYDLIILDLMLPGINGLDICQQLRTRSNSSSPVSQLLYDVLNNVTPGG